MSECIKRRGGFARVQASNWDTVLCRGDTPLIEAVNPWDMQLIFRVCGQGYERGGNGCLLYERGVSKKGVRRREEDAEDALF